MKIGVTSQNFKTVTGHAGKARRFMIFEQKQNDELETLDRLDLPKSMAIHEFSGTEHPLDELDVLITNSCGEGFKRKMLSRNIEVIETVETDPITAVEQYCKRQ